MSYIAFSGRKGSEEMPKVARHLFRVRVGYFRTKIGKIREEKLAVYRLPLRMFTGLKRL